MPSEGWTTTTSGTRDQCEQGKILLPVERHLAHHERNGGQRRSAVDADRVSVGRTLGEGIDPRQAAGAGAVLDDDLLAERGAKSVSQRAREQIGGTAGGERHDQLDGLHRVCLRPSRRRP
jgi:hypothetical protein